MIKYFRVGNKVDDLPLYVKGEDLTAAKAVAKVEELTGPLPPNLLTVAEVAASKIPEDEDCLDADETVQ